MTGHAATLDPRPTVSRAGVAALLADPPDVATILLDGPLVAAAVGAAGPGLTPDADPLTPARLRDPHFLRTLAADLAADRPPCYPVISPEAVAAVRAAWRAAPGHGVPPGLAAAVTRLTFHGPVSGSPEWLTTLLATLTLDPADAAAVGAPGRLARVVRAARAAPVGPAWLNTSIWTPPGRDILVSRLRSAAESSESAVRHAAAVALCDRLTARLAVVRSESAGRLLDDKLAALAEFAAGASHEINNPLAVIRGYAQLLLAKEADPAKQASLRTVVAQTARIHDILQGTRQFARPPVPRRGVVDLAAVAATALDYHRLDAERKGVTLHAPRPTAFAPLAAADAGQVTQIVSHLVQNAVHAAPPGGWARVAVGGRGASAGVVVSDSGPGPTAADVPHLFDPFYSGRAAGRGRGLGLSIAWRLARQNGGAVRLLTQPGPTRFGLVLPRAAEADARRAG